MINKDVMLGITVTLLRDGTVGVLTKYPTEAVAADKVVILGMLEVAKQSVVATFIATKKLP